jgi:PPOX class probable F420-dependent enzyme
VIDGTPKSTFGLRRLDNLRADPRACLLIDEYRDDWSQLWWVRLDTRAREVASSGERGEALQALRAKYPRYREQVLSGAVLCFDIDNWFAWESTPTQA